jgi:protein disulfide-isomerase
LEKTQRGKHGGGDADWEEKKLGSYKTSEVRLVEIQEMLCTDIVRGEQQCQNLAEEHESEIETWWKQQEDHPGELER